MRKFLLYLFLNIILLIPVQTRANDVVYTPKADNFIFLVDHSGSMAMHLTEETLKIHKAKEVLTKINELLPPLKVQMGLYTITPFEEYLSIAPYDKTKFKDNIDDISERFSVFGRLTPLGNDLKKIEPILSKLKGKTKVIVITDGGQNKGLSPIDSLKEIYEKYPNVCFYFIGVGSNPKQTKLLTKLTELKECSFFIEAKDLSSQQEVTSYLEKVFYGEKTTEITKKATKSKPIPIQKPIVKPKPKVVKPKPSIKPKTVAPIVKVEQSILLRSINFDFNSAKIKKEALPILKEVAVILKQYPNKKIIIAGHTCSLGPAKYNLKLSKKRAQSVAKFLIAQGIKKTRIKTIGYGESKPKFSNATKKGRSLNRRVEITLK
ncbi:OmpA-OmpF porin, OOP family [Desulfonauticus submarinus]|uniref:OmpA-OmpF porin, OOP family n=1 Tax=Desulfonauticus submarinus TaxID=206665 RepID=A0A1H0FWT7_9BACT|nr:OmpA family protein [Desulfonauticus submarinus]SDN99095.1 OmpA-OmpF porin, OOP family [Desulfonauticus submarinus]